jgi:hypothetical protein
VEGSTGLGRQCADVQRAREDLIRLQTLLGLSAALMASPSAPPELRGIVLGERLRRDSGVLRGGPAPRLVELQVMLDEDGMTSSDSLAAMRQLVVLAWSGALAAAWLHIELRGACFVYALGRVGELLEQLDEHGLLDRTLLSAGDPRPLRAIRRRWPRTRLGWIVCEASEEPASPRGRAWARAAALATRYRAARLIRSGRADALVCDPEIVSPRLVGAVHRAGGRVYTRSVRGGDLRRSAIVDANWLVGPARRPGAAVS